MHIIEIMHFFTYSIQLAVGREIFFYVIFRELDYIFIIVIRGRFLKRKNCIRGLTQKIAKGENEPLLGQWRSQTFFLEGARMERNSILRH